MHPIDELAPTLLVGFIFLLVAIGISVMADMYCLHAWRWKHVHMTDGRTHCNACCRKEDRRRC